MEDNGMKTERKGTGKSAIGLAVIAILVIALIAVVAWLLTQPGVIDTLVEWILLIAGVVVVLAVIAFIAYMILGVGMYATKGEVLQTGVSHSLDDIEAVDGNNLDKEGKN